MEDSMSQRSIKMDRRTLRMTARKEKNYIINRYMNENWDKVIRSSVFLIRSFKFRTRFYIAMTILFKPIKREDDKQTIKENKEPTVKDTQPAPIPIGQKS
jgi:hypothetical protein